MMILKIAWRNIWRNKLRSGVVMAALAVGIWAGVFIIAFSTGMNNQRKNDMLKSMISHVQLHDSAYLEDPETKYFISGNNVLDSIKSADHVLAYSPRIKLMGFASTARGNGGVQIEAVNPELEKNVTNISTKLVEGKYLTGTKKNAIIIGQALAEKLKTKIKKEVILRFQDYKGDRIDASFKIVGIFKSMSSKYDEMTVFTRLDDVSKLLGIDGKYHEIALWLDDIENSKQVVDHLNQVLPTVKSESWKTTSPELGYADDMMGFMLYIIIGIFLIALLGIIVNTMLMAILERKRELGMIICVGMNKTKVFLMIVYETVMLSVLGGLIGVFLGWGTVTYYGQYGLDLSIIQQGLESFGMGTIIYTEIPTSDLVKITLMVFFTAVLASAYPAWRAMKMNPAETVRAI